MSEMDIILSKINAENRNVTCEFVMNELSKRWDDFTPEDKREVATAILGNTQMLENANLLQQKFTNGEIYSDDELTTLITLFSEKAQLLSDAMVDFIDISIRCLRSVFI